MNVNALDLRFGFPAANDKTQGNEFGVWREANDQRIHFGSFEGEAGAAYSSRFVALFGFLAQISLVGQHFNRYLFQRTWTPMKSKESSDTLHYGYGNSRQIAVACRLLVYSNFEPLNSNPEVVVENIVRGCINCQAMLKCYKAL